MMPGEPALPELETERVSSSKGSLRKRSSSERYEEGRSSRSDSESESRLGHEGKAQEASWELRLREEMSMGCEAAHMEL